MDQQLELYKKAAELANIGIWKLNIKNNELFWDFITKKIFETPDNYEPLLHEVLSLYIESTETGHIGDEIQKTILTGKTLSSQFQIKTFKGNVRWVEINSEAVYENEECLRLVGTIQDITAKKKLMEDMELNHYKFLTAFDHAPIGMALVSLEGKWMKVNNSICRMLGYERNELMALTFQELTHPEDLQTDLEHVQSLLNRKASTYAMQKRYFHKNGQVVWSSLTVAIVWNADDTPLYFISQIQDITDTVKHTERLKKERQRLKNVIETTRIGTWEWNFTLNKVTNDDRCFAMLGYANNELEMTKVDVVYAQVHPDDVAHVNERLEECLSQRADYYQCEYRMRHKDGSWVWIESHGKVIKWSIDKKPLVMLGTREDISRRKQIEEVQQKTMNIISDQNKRLINFAHIVSHNLRSHAGNFQMLLELLHQEQDEKEKAHMLGLLTRNADNLSETIANLNEVVSFQLNDKKQTKSINIYKQINKTLTGIQALVEKEKATFNILVDKGLNINFNPAYLESILLNFFTNAIKYKHPERRPEILIKGFLESDKIILEITDNGLGIDLKQHGKKLFGMYKTFHEHADSRGIGLFITKNQVESLGGTIAVESKVNLGTTFRLSLLN
ncbi:PAS domain-containing sensor histidine kinase [Pedobacter sp. PWIIR3]